MFILKFFWILHVYTEYNAFFSLLKLIFIVVSWIRRMLVSSVCKEKTSWIAFTVTKDCLQPMFTDRKFGVFLWLSIFIDSFSSSFTNNRWLNFCWVTKNLVELWIPLRYFTITLGSVSIFYNLHGAKHFPYT